MSKPTVPKTTQTTASIPNKNPNPEPPKVQEPAPASTPEADPEVNQSPAPAPSPDQPESSDPEAAPGRMIDDPLMAAVKRDMGLEDPNPEPEPAPAVVPPTSVAEEPETTPAPEPVPETAPAPKKKVVRRAEPAAAPVPPAPEPVDEPTAPVTKPTEEEAFIATLPLAVQRELEDYHEAEEIFPDKHKGKHRQLVDWLKGVDGKIEELRQQNPQRTFDKDDEEFTKLMGTKPKLPPGDARLAQERVVERRLTDRIKRESERELSEIKRRQVAIEVAPTVAAEVDAFREAAIESFAGDEDPALKQVAGVIKEKGLQAAIEEFPLEARVTAGVMGQVSKMLESYRLMAHGAQMYDRNNPTHQMLGQFLQKVGDEFEASGGQRKLRGGKVFVHPAKFSRLTPEQQAKAWTFDLSDVEGLLASEAGKTISEQIKAAEERAAAFGYVRRPKASTPVRKDDPPVQAPDAASNRAVPRAKPTPAIGVKTPSPAPASDDHPGRALIDTMGLKRRS